MQAIRQMQMSAEQLDDLVAVMLEQTQKVCFNTSHWHSKKGSCCQRLIGHRAKVCMGAGELQDDSVQRRRPCAPRIKFWV